MRSVSARPRLALSGDEPPQRLYRGLRRLKPLEQQVQSGVIELLQRMHEVAWAHKVPAGAFCVVRHDPSSGLSARSQLEAAAAAGYFKKSQIAFIQAAPEGVLDLSLQLTGSGTHCELEVKQPGKKPTEAQLQRMQLVRTNGGFADWTDDIDEVQSLIQHWRNNIGGTIHD